MPRTHRLQTSFTSGVLDPLLAARKDLNQYYQGLSIGKNVLLMPQGGFKRRPGMSLVYDISYEARLAAFSFNTEQTYLLAFINNTVRIFKDGVLQTSLATPWPTAALNELRWTQSADTMILVHPSYSPRKITRGSSHTAWTISTYTLNNIPQHNFGDALSPTPVSEVQDIDYTGGWVNGDAYVLDLGGEVTATITYNATGATHAASIQAALRALPNTSASGITVAHVSGTVWRVTFGGDDSGIDWPLLVGTASGRTFSITETTPGSGADEDVWSSTRGWPATVTYFNSRLWFGGSSSRPQTVWASVVNDFNDFDVGTGLDDEAIDVTLNTDQVNKITGIYPGRHLQLFTTGGEFYCPEQVITPANVSFRRATMYGSKENVNPVAVDGATLFVERRGKAVREFLFTYVEEAYAANALSILASHLIKTPVAMAAQRGTSEDDANYIYVINSDGTGAVLNTMRSEGVQGWSEWETDGLLKDVAVVDDEVYFFVQRTINGVTRYYIEQAVPGTFTDSNSVQTIAGTTVTGLSHLNGEECRVKADGAVMANKTPSGGSITLERSATDVEVGLHYDVDGTTMPLNQDFERGPTLMDHKRIVKVQISLYESLGVIINGKRLPDRVFSASVPIEPVPDPFTGIKDVYLMGWDREALVTISQDDPLPMTVRGINIEVESNDG